MIARTLNYNMNGLHRNIHTLKRNLFRNKPEDIKHVFNNAPTKAI